MPAPSAGRIFFLMYPHFSVEPHMRGYNDYLLPNERQFEVSPIVSVCTSTGEVGSGAIKVMGPSAVPCRLLGY